MKSSKQQLTRYRSMRDFRKTSEPHGDGSGAQWKRDDNPIFVIQQHDARQMHYDFRLEIDGTLKSWAVPKGPSTDPKVKRLAVRTEDHPIEYADFEGAIPEGEYGAGTVLVWDAGPYRNLRQDKDDGRASMTESLKQGHIEIWLEGKKIRGGYALVNSKLGGDPDNWLLIKMKDDAADARRNPVSTQPESVISGRTIKEVAAAESSSGKHTAASRN